MGAVARLYAMALLFCAGLAAIIHFESIYGLSVPFLLLFVRRAGIRVVAGFIFMYLIVPVMPEKWYEAFVRIIVKADSVIALAASFLSAVWAKAPMWARIFMTMAGAILSGIVIAIAYVLHIRMGRIPIVGEWMREKGFPFLARSAAAQSVESQFDSFWEKIPLSVRTWLRHRYMWLWWKTVPPLVEAHQIFGKRKAFLSRRRRLRSARRQRQDD